MSMEMLSRKDVNYMDITTMGPTVMAITIITYLIGMIAKALPFVQDKFIPAIVGVFGGILGVVGMYIVPEFPANDLLNAVSTGILSGLASTGVNQLFKQMTAKSE